MKRFSVSRKDNVLNDEAYHSYQENGYAILEGFLIDEEVKSILDVVTRLAEYESETKKCHNYTSNAQRVWNLINKDVIFQNLLLSPQIDLWMNKIFHRDTKHRKYFLSSFQANILHPQAQAQILHVDTPIPEPIPPYTIKVNTIWALNDFTHNNGATEVIPKTHRNSLRPSREPTESDIQKLIKVIIPKGSVLITDGNLWHRSGSNQSEHSRYALLGSFAASYMREIACEDDSARFLTNKMKSQMTPEIYDMIGGNHGVKPGNDY
jgi:ectoine hydroxylase-related dioxygenase (phytanoyl-CoA dioxygenase family)